MWLLMMAIEQISIANCPAGDVNRFCIQTFSIPPLKNR